MNHTTDFIYSSTSSDAALPEARVSPATVHSFDDNTGDRAVKASSNDGSQKSKSEFREFGELFSAAPAPRNIEPTILTNNQGYATKVFTLNESGELSKRSAANIYEGHAEHVAIANVADLHDLIGRLPPTQALCFGVAKRQRARLLTQETLRSGSYPDAIARDRDHFSFGKRYPAS